LAHEPCGKQHLAALGQWRALFRAAPQHDLHVALSVLSDAARSRRRPVIVSAAALLSLVLISANGIVNYSRPGLPDFKWAAQVARAKDQQMREIPIPPGWGWTIRLP